MSRRQCLKGCDAKKVVIGRLALTECNAQVARAAEIVTGHLDFKYRTDTGTQHPQRIGGVVPVCMDGYRMVHGTTRIPGEDIDEIRTHIVPSDGDAHILLMIGSFMFKLDVQVPACA